jgi:KDO2-lipid IV(A) lauroyltransferase
VHLVREEELDPRAQAFIRDLLRERMGERYHSHFATDDPRLALELREALRGGAIVALQGDRPRSGGRSLTVELFGHPFELPEGPLALARATGASVLPVFVLRTGRERYRLFFDEVIDVAQSEDRSADLAAAARRYAAALAGAIVQAPHQWFCFRPLWEDPARGRGTG